MTVETPQPRWTLKQQPAAPPQAALAIVYRYSSLPLQERSHAFDSVTIPEKWGFCLVTLER